LALLTSTVNSLLLKGPATRNRALLRLLCHCPDPPQNPTPASRFFSACTYRRGKQDAPAAISEVEPRMAAGFWQRHIGQHRLFRASRNPRDGGETERKCLWLRLTAS